MQVFLHEFFVRSDNFCDSSARAGGVVQNPIGILGKTEAKTSKMKDPLNNRRTRFGFNWLKRAALENRRGDDHEWRRTRAVVHQYHQNAIDRCGAAGAIWAPWDTDGIGSAGLHHLEPGNEFRSPGSNLAQS